MNPIMQMLNRSGNNSNLLGLVSMLRSGNPEAMMQQLMQTNPQFRSFMETNKGKTPEQIAKDYGVDLGSIQSLLI